MKMSHITPTVFAVIAAATIVASCGWSNVTYHTGSSGYQPSRREGLKSPAGVPAWTGPSSVETSMRGAMISGEPLAAPVPWNGTTDQANSSEDVTTAPQERQLVDQVFTGFEARDSLNSSRWQ